MHTSWRSLCTHSHMQISTRTQDSYPPFGAGAEYVLSVSSGNAVFQCILLESLQLYPWLSAWGSSLDPWRLSHLQAPGSQCFQEPCPASAKAGGLLSSRFQAPKDSIGAVLTASHSPQQDWSLVVCRGNLLPKAFLVTFLSFPVFFPPHLGLLPSPYTEVAFTCPSQNPRVCFWGRPPSTRFHSYLSSQQLSFQLFSPKRVKPVSLLEFKFSLYFSMFIHCT